MIILFEGNAFETDSPRLTGLQIKILVHCKKNFVLFQEVVNQPKDRMILDSASVKLEEEMYFYSLPQGTSL